MTPRRLVPDDKHPISVTPTGHRVVVRAGGRVVADTRQALTLQESTYPPVQYVPLADVDQSLLTDSTTTTHCPYKGDADYQNVTVDQTTYTDAIWSYPTPYDAVSAIAGHLAFYADKVDIEVSAD